ncbi:hypothetical protein [Amycolatopsis jejuensis]|uniref:hypothetical protein n=1 Tax=Amycolatopsis jejuensis TaxID=330084 RepID=UPI0005256D90|nr:hypothetical protein [Amycolatopsis jejuensis]
MSKLKRSAVVTIAAAALMGIGPIATADASTLISEIPCNSSEYTKISVHSARDGRREYCYANGGEMNLPRSPLLPTMTWWLHEIHTGNNRVQWFGDGRWQPSNPIGKNTTYTFPNHPGGVKIEKIRIV